MSRTYKDAPWWVKSNRKQGILFDEHDHAQFGVRIYEIFAPLDENYQEIWTPQEETYLIPKGPFEAGKEYEDEENLVVKKDYTGKLTVYQLKTHTYEQLKTEREIVGYYSEYCTINEPLSAHEKYIASGVFPQCYRIDKDWGHQPDITDEIRRVRRKTRRNFKQQLKTTYKGVSSYDADEYSDNLHYSMSEEKIKELWRWERYRGNATVPWQHLRGPRITARNRKVT